MPKRKERFIISDIALTEHQLGLLPIYGCDLESRIVQEAHEVSGVHVGPTKVYDIKLPIEADITIPPEKIKQPRGARWWANGMRITIIWKKGKDLAGEKIPGTLTITGLVRGPAFEEDA